MRPQPLIRPILTGADVSGGAVLAGSIGSRPLRDLFVAVLGMLVLEVSPEKMGPSRHNPGFCTSSGQRNQGESFEAQGLSCRYAFVRSPIFPALAAVTTTASGRALRKLSNCGIKSGPAPRCE